MSSAPVERTSDRLRVGIVGLGTISDQIARSVKSTPGYLLSAGADIRREARRAFEQDHAVPTFENVEAMCDGDHVDVVWVATPNRLHSPIALAALSRGKHIVCEKPLAVTMRQCNDIVEAGVRSGRLIVQGHSKIFDPPIQALRARINQGDLGRVLRIDSWLFNDWLRRPRLQEELDVGQGGGVVLRQGPHMIDIVRYLAGDRIATVKSTTGSRDAADGNFAALLEFGAGAAASLSFSGRGYFDCAELTWGIGASGQQRELAELRHARPALSAAMSPDEKYGSAMATAPARSAIASESRLPFFGLHVVHCEQGVLRQSPDGLLVYGDGGCENIAVAAAPAGSPELHELRVALDQARPPFPDARWGRDTVEICLAILASARRGRAVRLPRPAHR